jgi:hypothetical protein
MRINWRLILWGGVWFSCLVLGTAGIIIFYNFIQSDNIFLVLGAVPAMLVGYFFLWVHFKIDVRISKKSSKGSATHMGFRRN